MAALMCAVKFVGSCGHVGAGCLSAKRAVCVLRGWGPVVWAVVVPVLLTVRAVAIVAIVVCPKDSLLTVCAVGVHVSMPAAVWL